MDNDASGSHLHFVSGKSTTGRSDVVPDVASSGNSGASSSRNNNRRDKSRHRPKPISEKQRRNANGASLHNDLHTDHSVSNRSADNKPAELQCYSRQYNIRDQWGLCRYRRDGPYLFCRIFKGFCELAGFHLDEFLDRMLLLFATSGIKEQAVGFRISGHLGMVDVTHGMILKLLYGPYGADPIIVLSSYADRTRFLLRQNPFYVPFYHRIHLENGARHFREIAFPWAWGCVSPPLTADERSALKSYRQLEDDWRFEVLDDDNRSDSRDAQWQEWFKKTTSTFSWCVPVEPSPDQARIVTSTPSTDEDGIFKRKRLPNHVSARPENDREPQDGQGSVNIPLEEFIQVPNYSAIEFVRGQDKKNNSDPEVGGGSSFSLDTVCN